MELKPEKNIKELIPETKNIFSDEELDNISGLCSVLQKIRSRLISEGYSIDELRKKLLVSTKDML